MGKTIVKVPDKMTDSEKKKIKQANKAKANPQLTAEKQKKKAAKAGETVTQNTNDE
jgi:hypothetical protein